MVHLRGVENTLINSVSPKFIALNSEFGNRTRSNIFATDGLAFLEGSDSTRSTGINRTPVGA